MFPSCFTTGARPALAVLLVATMPTTTEAHAVVVGATTRVSVASDGAEADAYSSHNAISSDGNYVVFRSNGTNLVADEWGGGIFVHNRKSGTTTRAGLASDGSRPNGSFFTPDIGGDGRYVAFTSNASNLVPGDTNGVTDVYVRDRKAGRTERVSVASDGTQGNAPSTSFESAPSISPDGRYIAFASEASNLVPGDTNLVPDVFVHDRQSRTTSRVSVSSATAAGVLQGDDISLRPEISADGRYVAFESSASTLVGIGRDTNRARDIFVHDRQTAITNRMSVTSTDVQAEGASFESDISADGRYVTFASAAGDLIEGDANNNIDAFVHDRHTGATSRASVSSDGAESNGSATSPSISADGRFVVFSSLARNLAPGDTNDAWDVFRHDRHTGITERVSIAGDGSQGDKGGGGMTGTSTAQRAAISADGHAVAFLSDSVNLVAGDTNNSSDVFVRDSGPPPLPVSVGDVTVYEGDAGYRAAVFTVTLSKPAATTVTVAYATASDGASATDFTSKAGILSFEPGVTSQLVKVPVAGDKIAEGDETFVLTLSSPQGAVIVDDTGVGTILDDEASAISGRRLTIGDVSVHEGDSGARVAVFNVSLSAPSTSYVTVAFATAVGGATDSDFSASSGTLRFAPGTTSLNLKVALTPDTITEDDHSFTVKLTGPTRATIADRFGLGTIFDND